MSELLLGVNIDHVATLRNARGTAWPDPVQAALIAEQARTDCITVHLREDRRHLTDRDIQLLRKTIQTRMNLKIAVVEGDRRDGGYHLQLVAALLLYCLVPEKRQEVTTEGGLDVTGQCNKLRQAVARLSNAGIQVSLFIDANKRQIEAEVDVGAPYIEIHTSTYADVAGETSRAAAFARISLGAQYAATLGHKVNAGYCLDYHNVKPVATLAPMQELNIGHAIISRALISRLAEAVRDMKCLIREAHC